MEGRKDFHVKIRGFRVNMQHVQQVLLNHSAVAEAVVIALPDMIGGHRLHAMVRRRVDCQVTSLDLFRYCSVALARQAIPSGFSIGNDPLPRTTTGKIDRLRIRQALLNGEQYV